MHAAALSPYGSSRFVRTPAFGGILLVSYIAGAIVSFMLGVSEPQAAPQDTAMRMLSTPSDRAASADASRNGTASLGDGTIRIVIAPPLQAPTIAENEPAPAVAAPVSPVAPTPPPARPAADAVPKPREAVAKPPATKTVELAAAMPVEAPVGSVDAAPPDPPSIFTPQLGLALPAEMQSTLAQIKAPEADALSPLPNQTPEPTAAASTLEPAAASAEANPKDGENTRLRRNLFDRIFGAMRIGGD